jgi:hypothetical protein
MPQYRTLRNVNFGEGTKPAGTVIDSSEEEAKILLADEAIEVADKSSDQPPAPTEPPTPPQEPPTPPAPTDPPAPEAPAQPDPLAPPAPQQPPAPTAPANTPPAAGPGRQPTPEEINNTLDSLDAPKPSSDQPPAR